MGSGYTPPSGVGSTPVSDVPPIDGQVPVYNETTGEAEWKNTSGMETDPIFTASAAAAISVGDISNWNTAFGWGDHAGLYSLLSHNHDADYEPIGAVSTHESTFDHSDLHDQNTDTKLDEGGANEVTAAQVKTAVTHSGITTGNPHSLDAADVPYSPAAPSDWDDPDPTEVAGGLDDAIARVKINEGDISALQSGVGSAVKAPVQNVTALKALDTTDAGEYPDKVLINVEDSGLYRLDRDSSATESLPEIVQPTTGVGRWYRINAQINDHNLLANIQGGAVGEKNHLSNAQVSDLTAAKNHADTVTGNPHSLDPADVGAEPAFSKNGAFNKDFGSASGTVCEGDDARLSDDRNDPDAIHDNVNGEINAIASEKTTPASGDLIVIEDSAASYAKKKVQLGNIPGNRVVSPAITPSALLATTHDWNPSGLATARVIRASASGNKELTGIVAQEANAGIYITNIGAGDIKLKKENTGSAAANRFALTADLTIMEAQGVFIWYDSTSSRWRILTAQQN